MGERGGEIEGEHRWWLWRSSKRWEGGNEGVSREEKSKPEGERKNLSLEEGQADGRKEGRKVQAGRQAGWQVGEAGRRSREESKAASGRETRKKAGRPARGRKASKQQRPGGRVEVTEAGERERRVKVDRRGAGKVCTVGKGKE